MLDRRGAERSESGAEVGSGVGLWGFAGGYVDGDGKLAQLAGEPVDGVVDSSAVMQACHLVGGVAGCSSRRGGNGGGVGDGGQLVGVGLIGAGLVVAQGAPRAHALRGHRAGEDQAGGDLVVLGQLVDDEADAMVVVQQAGVDLSLGAERFERLLDGHGRSEASRQAAKGLPPPAYNQQQWHQVQQQLPHITCEDDA